MDNGVGYDEMEEPVLPSPTGRKNKRRPDSYVRNIEKRMRHSGQGTTPSIACQHTNTSSSRCQAFVLKEEDILTAHRKLYESADKVKQDTILLSNMDIKPTKVNSIAATPKRRSTNVIYYIMADSTKVPVCKETFMGIFCEYYPYHMIFNAIRNY